MRTRSAVILVFLLVAAPAAAQIPPPVVQPSPGIDFLTRFDVWMSASALAISNPKYSWDVHFGGSADVFDYGIGRLGTRIDYEAILGDELRPFDPNQSNYTLEANTSVRLGPNTEVVGVFHHVSRHLSDRPKLIAVAWNVLGGRLLQHASVGGVTVDVDAEAGAAVQHSTVDYRWVGELNLVLRRPLTPRAAAFFEGYGQLVGVNEMMYHRGTQPGGLAEAGLRITTRGGIFEIFAGVEQRIDAYPIGTGAEQWGLAGIRLLSR